MTKNGQNNSGEYYASVRGRRVTRRVRHSAPSKRRRAIVDVVVVVDVVDVVLVVARHPVTALLPRRRVSVWEFNASAGRATLGKRDRHSTPRPNATWVPFSNMRDTAAHGSRDSWPTCNHICGDAL